MRDDPADLAPDARPTRRAAPVGGGSSLAMPQIGGAALAGALRRRRVPLIACIILVPLLAAVALGRVTPLYTASGTVLYDDRGFAARELQSVLRVDPMTDAVMASQVEIARGLSIAERVSDQLGLDRDPAFNHAFRPPGAIATWLSAVRGGVASFLPFASAGHDEVYPSGAASRRDTLLAVRDAIAVSAVKASHVLEVSFTARDPTLAAEAADLTMRLYIEDQRADKIAAVQRATAWLDGRVRELRDAVQQAEDRIAAFRAARGLAQGEHAGLDAERITRLNEDLLTSRTALAEAQSRLDAANGRAGAAAQAGVVLGVVQARAQRDQIAGQLQALLAHDGTNHPEIVSLRKRLADADRAVAEEVGSVVTANAAEMRADRARVAMLEDALQRAQADQDRAAAAQVTLNTMQRDADAARGLLQSVLEGAQQTAQQTALETPDARIISFAVPPSEPSFPRRGLLLAAASAFGVLFGLLLVHLLELADGTFRSGEDVRARLGLRCLALIPAVGRRALGSGALGRGRLFDHVLDRPLGPFAEQIRALRAGLWMERARPRIVAFTAARPSEGKTTVALALARCAALCGERVVVVDCDLRQPSIGRMLGMDGGVGLVDCLQGRATLAEVIRRDPRTGLAVIPAGSLEVNALSLFLSETMATLLQQLRQDHDLILLDAPPALAMTDARVIAGMAEATVLCVRWHSTPLGVARDALGLLEEAQASVVGVALTRVDVRAHVRSGYADAEVYRPRHGGYFRE